jgi:hypothetical protein
MGSALDNNVLRIPLVGIAAAVGECSGKRHSISLKTWEGVGLTLEATMQNSANLYSI